MSAHASIGTRILDAAAEIIVLDGFEAVSASSVASRAAVTVDELLKEFGSVDEALVLMLNREFAQIYLSLVDHVERDPRGGLLSRIYYYTLAAIYERPLAKTLYTADRDAMNSIMRRANSFSYVPGVGIRSDFIESMQRAGMVRRDVDADMVSHTLTVFSAGLALTAPHEDLDIVVRGITDLLARSVDTDVTDTAPGKQAFYEWATTLVGTK